MLIMENQNQSATDQQVKPEVYSAQQNANNTDQESKPKEKEGIEQDGSIKNTK
jgi:hypothetical protein